MQIHGTTDNASPTANCPALLLNSDGSLNTGSGTTAGQVQGAAAANAAAAGNPVQVGGIYESTPSTYDNADAVPLHTDANGNLRARFAVNAAGGTDAFSNGSIGFAIASTANTNCVPLSAPMVFNGTSWDRVTKATTTSRIVSAAADTNATSAKASAGTLHSITGYNAAAAVRYLKLYNKASAPTVGTDTPVITIAIKPSDYIPPLDLAYGRYFSTGIAYALTTGSADNDTGALTAADIVGLNVNYS